ncbi:Hpt domain-containing protein [Aquitalea denitrificans]|uniref:Hpt domain-containing protein n=1 Tax=Aquitalea denitrificans TaxID=519081 RepID=UPI00135CDED7|nr:Hpt domain-containing protein [Aquitalea denitrificans]
MLTARHRGQAADAVPLASLLRQLHLRFQPQAQHLQVDFSLELDSALAAVLQLNLAVLQQLLMQLLSLVLPAQAGGRLVLKAQVWAQQHMRQILTLELIASCAGDAGMSAGKHYGPACARKRRHAPADWLHCRQLARSLGAELSLESGAHGMHISLQLKPTMPEAQTSPGATVAGRWPVLLLCADAEQSGQLQRQLQGAGYPLKTVNTVAAALQCWQQQAVAALLLAEPDPGCSLPALLQPMRRLESIQPWRGHTPLLAVLPEPHALPQALEPMPDGWLPRSFDCTALSPWLPECALSNTAALPVLDRAVLFDLSQGDWALELPLLQHYLQDKQADLGLLLHAWQQGDLPACVALAHRIKGASRTVGAHRLAEAAASLEQAARAGLGDSLPTMLLTLEQALEDFAQHLQSAAEPVGKPGTGMAQ